MRTLDALRITLALESISRKLTFDKRKWNESDHPRRKDGKFGTGGRTSTAGKKSVRLGFDETKPTFIPETTTKGHDKHHEKHAKEMHLTMKQWKQEAAALLNAKPSKDFLDWYNEDDETFCRYNKKTGRLVVGDPGGTINTYFDLKKKNIPTYIPKAYLDEL